jgi:probable HAF family extracellular repeat protein
MTVHRVLIAILAFLVPICASAAYAIGPYTVTDLGVLSDGSLSSRASDINSRGQVVGVSGTSTSSHAFLWSPAIANGTSGVMISLGDLAGGAGSSDAVSVNSVGQVVGSTSLPHISGIRDPIHAFLWTPDVANGTSGAMHDLGVLPSNPSGDSYANGINSLGQVAGFSDHVRSGSGLAGFSAFLWTPSTPNGDTGSMIDLGLNPVVRDRSSADGINARGQVTGTLSNATIDNSPFLWTPGAPNGDTGVMIDLGLLPGGFNEGLGSDINDAGQVVGWDNAGFVTSHAFLWTPTSLNQTTGALSPIDLYFAHGINSQGDVVGLGITGYAALWVPSSPNGTSGTAHNLNDLRDPSSGAGWTLIEAFAINDFGQIVGNGMFDSDGPGGVSPTNHAFLLTPLPEPTTAAMFAISVIGCAFCHRPLPNRQ